MTANKAEKKLSWLKQHSEAVYDAGDLYAGDIRCTVDLYVTEVYYLHGILTYVSVSSLNWNVVITIVLKKIFFKRVKKNTVAQR